MRHDLRDLARRPDESLTRYPLRLLGYAALALLAAAFIFEMFGRPLLLLLGVDVEGRAPFWYEPPAY